MRWSLLLLGAVLPLAGSAAGAGEAPPDPEPAWQDLFALRLIAPERADPGLPLRARIQAFSPYTSEPRPGIEVKAVLEVEAAAGERSVSGHGRTGAAGEVILELPVPEETLGASRIDLRVEGRGDRQVRRASASVLVWGPSALLSTDKAIYRPGQELRMRALWRRAPDGLLAESPVSFEVRDPRGSLVFSRRAVTSPSGIAGVAWRIPERIAEGTYRVTAAAEATESEAVRRVEIVPYELPRFTVAIEPARPWFLAGEEPRVEVAVATLAGAPIPGARVSVEPDWWPERWGPAPRAEGTTGRSGSVQLALDLARHREGLDDGDRDRWPFRDVQVVATARHPASGREERVRGRLRLTRDPIHVYPVAWTLPEQSAAGAEVAHPVYATTFTAGGEPVACELGATLFRGERVLAVARFRTGELGVGRLDARELAAGLLGAVPEGEGGRDGLEVELAVRDEAGRTGRTRFPVSSAGTDSPVAIRAETHVLSSGEPVRVRLVPLEGRVPATEARPQRLLVTLEERGRTRESLEIEGLDAPRELALGRGLRLGGVVTVAVRDLSPPHGRHGRSLPVARWSFVVLEGDPLRLELRPDRDAYRPGETMGLRLRTLDGGDPAASTIGLAIVDRVVELRQQELAGTHGPALLAGVREETWSDTLGEWTLDRIARLDPADPIPQGLDLVAEVLLARRWPTPGLGVRLATPIGEAPRRYRDHFEEQLAPVAAALEAAFRPPLWRQPETVGQLLSILREDWPAGRPAPDRLLDPWGTPYHPEITVRNDKRRVVFHTAGRDGRWATIDDFAAWSHGWRYFRPAGERLDALLEHRLRQGELIRDAESLRRRLGEEGLAPESLVDPWGRPYRFELWSRAGRYGWEVWSAGPDGRFEEDEGRYRWQDVRVWRAGADFGRRLAEAVGAEVERLVEPVVAEGGRDSEAEEAQRPASLEALEERLGAVALPLDGDPWGRPFRFEATSRVQFTDLLVHRATEPGSPGFLDPRAVTVRILEVRLTSRGPDSRWGTGDDRSVARLAFPYRWEGAGGETAEGAGGRAPELAEGMGLLAGTVLDDAGNPLPGVRLEIGRGAAPRTTFSDAEGRFHSTLPAGEHTLTASLEGFSGVEYPGVQVLAGRVTWLDVVLTPAVEEVITVTSESPPLAPPPPEAPGAQPAGGEPPPMATPRLRRDFPETLLWLPEVEIDEDGEARIEVPLADNVTTWSVAALASDRAGQLAWAEARVPVSQPFYAEPDLPPVLTAGDRIDLPVILANLTGEDLPVHVELESPGRKARSLTLRPGAEGRADLPVAFDRVGEVPVRVTARGGDLADAIERTTRVRPRGREVVEVASALVPLASEVEITVPADARPGTAGVEVLVYPDLASHLREATEELLRRPAGCGEQIVSTAWPALLLLRLPGAGEENGSAPARAEAVVRLEAARAALASVRTPPGGFAYWPEGRPDAALTAYVLEFLREASRYVEVEGGWISRAARWLARTQGEDGLWRPPRGPEEGEDPVEERRVTAVAALSLARLAGAGEAFLDEEDRRLTESSVARALALLGPAVEGSGDPYALAAYALALRAAGDREGWSRAAGHLGYLATAAEGGLYWEGRFNTPYHGWGRSGRLETTGLAVQALLAGDGALEPGGPAELGLAYLLRARGADDLWGSTQATVQALRAVVAGLGARPASAGALPALRLDGARLVREASGGDGAGGAPVRFRAVGPVEAGRHRVMVEGSGGGWTLIQAVLRYRVPWEDGAVRADAARHLRLEVACSPGNARTGTAAEPRECRLSAERVGFRGGGMLIAELGLPPGVEVDRGALEEERRGVAGLSDFELRPDRVVLYLWPAAGGVDVPVRFTPRMGIDALAAPSALYDYYNPDARVTLPPVRYRISPPPGGAAGSRTGPGQRPPPRSGTRPAAPGGW